MENLLIICKGSPTSCNLLPQLNYKGGEDKKFHSIPGYREEGEGAKDVDTDKDNKGSSVFSGRLQGELFTEIRLKLTQDQALTSTSGTSCPSSLSIFINDECLLI